MSNVTDGPLVLGIETSCDETGVGIVRGRELLADEVASSMDQHARFGGVVPEVASRAHLEAMVPVHRAALRKAGLRAGRHRRGRGDRGPGPGRRAHGRRGGGEGLRLRPRKPLYGVNHLAGARGRGPAGARAAARALRGAARLRRALVAAARGRRDRRGRPLGATIDDAAGEAYDKVAPGARPAVPRRAADRPRRGDGRPGRDQVPARKLHDGTLDFSFAGPEDRGRPLGGGPTRRRGAVPVADVAASFQEAVADVLTRKAVAACRDHGVARPGDRRWRGGELPAAGPRGSSAATRRASAARPAPGLCTDNGAMVAALGACVVAAGRPPSTLSLPADSSLPITEVLVP